jgi:hypothetical protein
MVIESACRSRMSFSHFESGSFDMPIKVGPD